MFLLRILIVVAVTIVISSVSLWIGALLGKHENKRFSTAFITVLIAVLIANVVNIFVPSNLPIAVLIANVVNIFVPGSPADADAMNSGVLKVLNKLNIFKLLVAGLIMFYFVRTRYKVSYSDVGTEYKMSYFDTIILTLFALAGPFVAFLFLM